MTIPDEKLKSDALLVERADKLARLINSKSPTQISFVTIAQLTDVMRIIQTQDAIESVNNLTAAIKAIRP